MSSPSPGRIKDAGSVADHRPIAPSRTPGPYLQTIAGRRDQTRLDLDHAQPITGRARPDLDPGRENVVADRLDPSRKSRPSPRIAGRTPEGRIAQPGDRGARAGQKDGKGRRRILGKS